MMEFIFSYNYPIKLLWHLKSLTTTIDVPLDIYKIYIYIYIYIHMC